MCVPSLVLIAQAAFPLERAQTEKQTEKQTDKQTRLKPYPPTQAAMPAWVIIIIIITIDGCVVWNAHNTVLGSKRSAICAQAVYFLYSTSPSVKWPNSRWGLAACDWVMSALSAVLSTRVGRRRTFREVFLYGDYRPGQWLWIDSNGKNGN